MERPAAACALALPPDAPRRRVAISARALTGSPCRIQHVFSRDALLRSFVQMYAVRASVHHRADYAAPGQKPFAIESETFLWTAKTVGAIARTCPRNGEFLDATSRYHKDIMKALPAQRSAVRRLNGRPFKKCCVVTMTSNSCVDALCAARC